MNCAGGRPTDVLQGHVRESLQLRRRPPSARRVCCGVRGKVRSLYIPFPCSSSCTGMRAAVALIPLWCFVLPRPEMFKLQKMRVDVISGQNSLVVSGGRVLYPICARSGIVRARRIAHVVWCPLRLTLRSCRRRDKPCVMCGVIPRCLRTCPWRWFVPRA